MYIWDPELRKFVAEGQQATAKAACRGGGRSIQGSRRCDMDSAICVPKNRSPPVFQIWSGEDRVSCNLCCADAAARSRPDPGALPAYDPADMVYEPDTQQIPAYQPPAQVGDRAAVFAGVVHVSIIVPLVRSLKTHCDVSCRQTSFAAVTRLHSRCSSAFLKPAAQLE